MNFLLKGMSASFRLKISKVFAALFLVFITASKASIAADAPTVLLLNSYHSQFVWTAELTQGVQDELTSKGMEKNLYVEYMDSRRFVDDAHYERQLGELLKYKYLQYEPDIVITSDDHAFYFMVEYGQEFFPDKPIVFSGVNVFKEQTIAGRNNIVGIQEGMEIEGNLELILKLQPDTKRIVLLGDRTGLGLRMVEKAKVIKSNWSENQNREHIQIDIWDDFSLAQLNQQASQMKPGTVFLMLAIHKDNQGNYFSFEEELPRLAEHSSVPIYGMWGALMIGNGVVGGMMNDPYQHGRQAASVATRVLAGESMSQIGVLEKAKFSPQFDYQVLDRFGIDMGGLPEESEVFNRPLSLYEKHQWLINGLLVLVIFLSVVISILIASIRKRVVAQEQLASLNAELESIVDERTKDLDERNQELERTSKQMEELAHTDNLTGISNRRSGNKEVKLYIQRYQISGEALSVALIDVDYFKSINDTLGHKLGDEVLCEVVRKISQSLRPSDRLYRWGGDEFLVALPQTKLEAAEKVCDRMCEEVRAISRSELNGVTVSIGLTSFRNQDNFDSMLVRADRALYEAKDLGRNQTKAV